MKPAIALTLLAALALVACRAPGGTERVASVGLAKAKATAPAHVQAASTTPAATAATAAASAAPASVAPSPVNSPASEGTPLLKPATAITTLTGTVKIDAGYVVSNNTGSLISNNGSAVLAAGAASLSADGRLISDHGGKVLSDHGGNLISNHGSGLISNNAGSFHLLAASGEKPAIGTVLPAAGVLITVRSLTSGSLLSVGIGAAGEPVYEVYTNLEGGYELYLPADAGTNVMVEARVPDTTDKRQQYALVAPASGAKAAVDEDTVLSSRELRDIFAAKIQTFMLNDPAVSLCILNQSKNITATTKAFVTALLTDMHTRSVAAGVAGDVAHASSVRSLSYRCADTMLARLDLDTIMLDSSTGVKWGPEEDPNELPTTALDALTACFKVGREAATAKLAADPTFFAQQPYFLEANACDPGRYQILKPADLNAFLLDEYLVNDSDPGLYAAGRVFDGMGASDGPDHVRIQHKLNIAFDTLGVVIARALALDAHGEKEAIFALLANYKPGDVPTTDASVPPVPCPRASTRTKLTDCLSGAASDSAATP